MLSIEVLMANMSLSMEYATVCRQDSGKVDMSSQGQLGWLWQCKTCTGFSCCPSVGGEGRDTQDHLEKAGHVRGIGAGAVARLLLVHMEWLVTK